MSETIQPMFDRLWADCTTLDPQAQRIHQLLTDRGDRVMIDHVALRTLRHRKFGIDATAAWFERHGFSARAEYEFPGERLYARHYESDNPGLPRVFISELNLEECSRGLRDMVDSMARQVNPEELADDALVSGGCPWYRVLKDTHERLRDESEYAAWVAAFGFRAHRFAILVNELDSFDSLQALNAFLEEQGYRLDDTDGEIRGTPGNLFEQSAMPATPCEVEFADGSAVIPGCSLAFAYRHPLPSGELFPGFLAQPAERVLAGTTPR